MAVKVKEDPNELKEIIPDEIVNLDIENDRFGYIAPNGTKVKLRPVDLVKIKRVRDSVKLPKRPMYDTRTVTGRTQSFFLDEDSIDQVPNGKQIWEVYTETRREATEEQNDRVIRALLFHGTEIGEIPDNDWEEEQALFGVETQTHENEKFNARLRWVEYLYATLGQRGLIGISNAIMRASGVTEEEIQEAEDAFRG